MAEELVRSDQADIERKEAYLGRVSHVQMGLAPKNLEEGLRLAELLAKSTLVPTDFRGNPGNILIAMQMGMEVGLAPMQAIQSIAVINGRPSLWGDGLLALVQASPVFESITESVADGVATCEVKRRGWPNPVTRTFSIEDAKRAHLWGKQGPWTNYPDRMLQMRARAFALRDVFADVLRGIASAEEMLDTTTVTVTEQKPDPLVAMRNDLACSEEQWQQIVGLWDTLKVPMAQRIVEAKKYSGHAVILAQKLIEMAAPLPPAPTIDTSVTTVTKHARKRLAKAKAEATAPEPAPPTDAGCEHGVPIDEPCDICISLADALGAEGEAVPAPPAKAETPQEYAARRKRELAAMNETPLPNVAPKSTEPF